MRAASAGPFGISPIPKPLTQQYAVRGTSDGLTPIPNTIHCFILQIHVRAGVQSDDYALNYSIPTVFPNSVRFTDPELFDVLYMLECNPGSDRPALCFPAVAPHTYAHLMCVSNPVLESYSYCDLAASGNRVAIANTLLSCRATTTKPDGIPPGLFARCLARRVGGEKATLPTATTHGTVYPRDRANRER